MFPSKLPNRLSIMLLLLPLSAPVCARDIDQLDWTGIKEHWGQTLLCQRIYSLPEVKLRLYDFDIEQCEQATLAIAEAVGRYSETEQVELKNQAERHAVLLSRNASEPYNAVPACRLFCRDLAENQD